MKPNELRMVIRPEASETKLLLMKGHDEVMKAVLPSSSHAHHRAAPTLAEAMALWFQQPLSVVLYADVWDEPFATAFCDGLGFGVTNLHYEVDLVEPGIRRDGQQLHFSGRFSELKRVCTRRLP